MNRPRTLEILTLCVIAVGVFSLRVVAQDAGQTSAKPAASDANSVKPASPDVGPVTGDFASNAFPPIMVDIPEHTDAWRIDNCMRCHETGVEDAPEVEHRSVPDIARVAKCRTCHVFVAGAKPPKKAAAPEDDGMFLVNAFPPMVPASDSHQNAWTDDNCLLCHEDGVRDAPIVKHEGLPPFALKAKCRSCHVQVRSAWVTND